MSERQRLWWDHFQTTEARCSQFDGRHHWLLTNRWHGIDMLGASVVEVVALPRLSGSGAKFTR
jgi:hypothetical protein